ncbi:MAG: ferrous iron transport protein B [Deltaproteobacteria bacterium]|nr:ferrous iron transport protein B [Deltaproteobacteria bacterium]
MDCHSPSHSETAQCEIPTVLIIGNPNTGKTTLFNALTGAQQKVANYPGITVEKKIGMCRVKKDQAVRVVDLPGCYSLIARSPEEQIAHDALLAIKPGFEKPDLVICIVDATNLERNLYLALQILELQVPMLLALNMIDEAGKKQIFINHVKLSEQLKVPVIPMAAAKQQGITLLKHHLAHFINNPTQEKFKRPWHLNPEIEQQIENFRTQLVEKQWANPATSDGEAIWLLTTVASHPLEPLNINSKLYLFIQSTLEKIRTLTLDFVGKVIEARYAWINEHIKPFIQHPAIAPITSSDRIDKALTHKFAGPLLLLLVFALLFQLIFTGADPFITFLEDSVLWLSQRVDALLPPGLIKDFIMGGIINGVGNVIVFIPQIAFLFGFLAILEESGYLARAAFIIDRLMYAVGLHGKAFIPLLSCFACAIPGIMASRTIEDRKDRLITILVAPLMTCSARLPVYALIIAIIFPPNEKWLGIFSWGGLVFLFLYFLGTFMALTMALLFKRTILKGPPPPLVLEMPPYRRPRLKNIFIKMLNSSKVFLSQAGTIIFITSLVLWVLLTFPRTTHFSKDYDAMIQQTADQPTIQKLWAEKKSESLRNSFAGKLGHVIEPAIAPLGFDWKIGVGLIGSFAAREVLISTLGIVYGVGEADETSQPLREKLQNEINPETGKKVITPLVGFSLMIFYVLACQCMSTLAVVRKETGTWKWPVFIFGYMSVLAYLGSLAVYQIGSRLGF